MRNCLVYVLHNIKRHAAQAGWRVPRNSIDPMSSASWFTGFDPMPTNRLSGNAALGSRLALSQRLPCNWLRTIQS